MPFFGIGWKRIIELNGKSISLLDEEIEIFKNFEMLIEGEIHDLSKLDATIKTSNQV